MILDLSSLKFWTHMDIFWQYFFLKDENPVSLACINKYICAVIVELRQNTTIFCQSFFRSAREIYLKWFLLLSLLKERCKHGSSSCKQNPCHKTFKSKSCNLRMAQGAEAKLLWKIIFMAWSYAVQLANNNKNTVIPCFHYTG